MNSGRSLPVGGDVALVCAKNHQYIRTVFALLPDRIGPRHMGGEHTALGVEFKRNMVRIQPLRRHGDQNPERVRLDDLVHDVGAFDGKVIGDVHGAIGFYICSRFLAHSRSRSRDQIAAKAFSLAQAPTRSSDSTSRKSDKRLDLAMV